MKKGFTIVELMVVMGIMSILGSIGYRSYVFHRNMSMQQQVKLNASLVTGYLTSRYDKKVMADKDIEDISKGIQSVYDKKLHNPLTGFVDIVDVPNIDYTCTDKSVIILKNKDLDKHEGELKTMESNLEGYQGTVVVFLNNSTYEVYCVYKNRIDYEGKIVR